MLYQSTVVTWATLAISSLPIINASPLFEFPMPRRSNGLAADNNPMNPEPSDPLYYCGRLPFMTDRGSLKPPEGLPPKSLPRAIFVADGQITYVCRRPNPTNDPLRPERSRPHWELDHLTADLFDIGSVLRTNRGFASLFLNQPTGTHGHPRGPKVGQMVQSSPAQLPQLVRNGRTFFSPTTLAETVHASTNQPNGSPPVVDRDWAHYTLKARKPTQEPVSAPITDLYEVKTVGGQIAYPDCVLGQEKRTVPYKAQLWAYGDREFPIVGVTLDACRN